MRGCCLPVVLLLACSHRDPDPPDGAAPPDAASPQRGDAASAPPDLASAPPDLWLPPAEGRARWSRSYNASGRAVGAAADGSVYFAGSFSRADFGDGTVTAKGLQDAFLIKYDRLGARLWARTFGRDWNDVPGHLAVDSSGVVSVVGYSLRSADSGSHDILLARYAPDGSQRMFRTYGGSQLLKVDVATGVAASADGGLFFTGGSEDTLDFGGGALPPIANRDVYLVSLGPDGSHRFSRRFGKSGYNQAAAVLAAPDGDVIIAGSGSPTLDFGDGHPSPSADGQAFVARFSSSGALRWSRFFPSRGSDATSLAPGPDGTLWVAGSFYDTVDLGAGPQGDGRHGVYWAQLSAQGRRLASFVQSSDAGLYVYGLATDRYGQVVLGGQADGVTDFGSGPSQRSEGRHFIVKRAADGRLRWWRRFGGTYLDQLSDVAVGPDDGVLAAGQDLSVDVTLDGVPVTRFGYVLALTP